MRIKEIEQMFAVMPGGQLLNELITYAALFLDANANQEEDNQEAIIRAIQARLAETGIARFMHRETCRFMLGDDQCACPRAAWTWPRQGMPKGL